MLFNLAQFDPGLLLVFALPCHAVAPVPVPDGSTGQLALAAPSATPLALSNATNSLYAAPKAPLTFKVLHRPCGRIVLMSPAGVATATRSGVVSLHRGVPSAADEWVWKQTGSSIELESVNSHGLLRATPETGEVSAEPSSQASPFFRWVPVPPSNPGKP